MRHWEARVPRWDLRRLVERLDHAGLAEGIVAPEQQGRVTTDRGADVLELELVGVGGVDCDLLDLAVRLPAYLDSGRVDVPGVVEEARLIAHDLELIAVRDDEAAVEVRNDIVWQAKRRGERDVDAARPDDLLRVHALGLACEKPDGVHAVAAHVHQRAALELGEKGRTSSAP